MLQSAYVFTAFGNGALDPTGPETTPDTGGYRVFRGSCWFHESDYCRAARYTTSIFLFVLLANSDLADTVGVAHRSVNSNRPPLSALLASTLAVFRTGAALQHCAMLLAVFDLPPIVLVPPAPISRPSNPEGRNK